MVKKWSFWSTFLFPWRRPCDYRAKCYINRKTIECLQVSRSTYPSICNSFPVIRTASAKNTRFRVPQPTFLFSSGDVPATTTLYFPWIKRELDACQTPRSMYLSILNTFRVIWCLSECVSVKNNYFYHIFPCGNHVKCYIDEKVNWERMDTEWPRLCIHIAR